MLSLANAALPRPPARHSPQPLPLSPSPSPRVENQRLCHAGYNIHNSTRLYCKRNAISRQRRVLKCAISPLPARLSHELVVLRLADATKQLLEAPFVRGEPVVRLLRKVCETRPELLKLVCAYATRLSLWDSVREPVSGLFARLSLLLRHGPRAVRVGWTRCAMRRPA